MSQDLRVALITTLKDGLSGPLSRVATTAENGLSRIDRSSAKLGATADQATSKVNSLLGRLGLLGGMRGPTRLTDDLNNAASSAGRLLAVMERMAGVGRAMGGLFAGAQAMRYVTREPLQQERGYERQLADAANIAYPYGERKAGMLQMDSAVTAAVRGGGGSREAALRAMNDLFAANIDQKDVLQLLPSIQKYATAGNADPSNISQLAIYFLRSLKQPADMVPLLLDKTLASTKGGSMEFDSLAKWMPQIGAAGSAAGLEGVAGYEKMLAALQVSRLTAGTKDEAGTNLKDLLSLINGHALTTAAKRMGIDSTGELAKYIGQGGDALGGIVALADHVAKSDPRFAAIDAKLKASTQRDKNGAPIYSAEQESLMRQQATLFQGSALGNLFHNQQSMQALVALRNNRDYLKSLLEGTGAARGQVLAQDFETISSTSSFKQQQRQNEQLIAMTGPLNTVNQSLSKFDEWVTGVYERNPKFAEAMEASKIAVWALAAAAGAAAGTLALLGARGGAGAAVGALAGAAAGRGGAAAAATAGRILLEPGVTAAGGSTAGAAAAGGGAMAGLIGGGTALSVGAVLGAGVIASEIMNSQAGLQARIRTRQDRINELSELSVMESGPGGSAAALAGIQRDLAALKADRDGLMSKVGTDSSELIREIKALANRPIQLTIDGREVYSSVNDHDRWKARRQ